MKLIIDVPDNVYAKVMEYYEHNGIVEAVYGYIYHGIPLEQISDEVNKLKKVSDGNKVYVGINDVLDIIDKYR